MITARFVRSLYQPKGYTYERAAKEIGISSRSMRRYISGGKGWRKPPMVVLVALRSLPPRGPVGLRGCARCDFVCRNCGRAGAA